MPKEQKKILKQPNSDLNKVPLRHGPEGENSYWTGTTYRLCLPVFMTLLSMSVYSGYLLMCMTYIIKNIF